MGIRKFAAASYIASIMTLGAGLLSASWAGPEAFRQPLPATAVLFWLLLCLASETMWLPTPRGAGMVSMSLAANLALLFVLPRAEALGVIALSVILSDLLLHRRAWLRALFNGTQSAVALAAAGGVMSLLGAPTEAGSRTFLVAPAATAAALPAFFLVNTLLVSGAIALHDGKRLWAAFRENFGFGYQILNAIALYLVGLGLVAAVELVGYISGLLVLVLLFSLREAYRGSLRRRAAVCS